MSLVGYRASNHPLQVARRGALVSVDDRATTPELFDPLNDRFAFTLDVAATADNAKCQRFYTQDDNGLAQSWADERVWCNPPYSALERWVRKAWAERDCADLIVMLVPANRTEQGWWQRQVEPYRDRSWYGLRTEFLPDRIRFLAPGQTGTEGDRPPFGCCLLIWNDRP